MATIYQALIDVLTNTEEYRYHFGNLLVDKLSPSSSFSHDSYHCLTDIQKVQSSFSVGGSTSRTLIDTQTLKSSFSPGINRLEYIGGHLPPFVFPGENPTPVTTNPVGLGPFNVGTTRYPESVVTFSSSRASITLKAPEFGNKDQYDETRINTNSRGLTLIQYRDHRWGDSDTYDVNFTLIDESEIRVILNFLRVTAGLVISYTDIYGLVHTGFIIDPENPATSAPGGYSIKFTFLEATPA